jgi:hypothetical protein
VFILKQPDNTKKNLAIKTASKAAMWQGQPF